jgi:L-galactose dehydrogenase
MRYRLLGNTGMRLSALGFGASPLGNVFGDLDAAEGHNAVRYAIDNGINYFDVSPYYGLTKAEAALGRALRGVARDKYILSTKVGRYAKDEFDFSPARVTATVDESLKRLGTDHADILFCHDIEFVEIRQVFEETLPALQKLRQQGKVRFLGVSGYPLRIFEEALLHAEIDAIISYCRYTLHDTSLSELLPELNEQHVGVINAAPLSMGLLRDQGPPPWHPAPPELKAAAARAARLCRERGGNLAQQALRFALANEAIACTLVGMKSVEEVRQNLAAFEAPPDEALIAEVRGIFAACPACRWTTGRPENQDA